MTQPDELKSSVTLLWSPGRGTDVWAMFCACVDDDLEGAKTLLGKEPALARSHYRYRTPIYFAVRENSLKVAEYLLDHGADPLSLAVNHSLLEIARDRGYNAMEKLLQEQIIRLHHASGRSEPVAAAIRERDFRRMCAFLNRDPELLHEGDHRGNQPLHWAVMTRQIDFIDELLARGANINARRFDGAQAVQLVNGDYHYRGWRDVPKEISATPEEVLAHLRSKGAYIDICTAAHSGDLARVRELLDHDPALANRVSDYVTYYLGSGSPLKNAAARGHIEILQLLLEHGADPNLPEEGIAPRGHALYAAVYHRHFDVAKLLLEHGAFPNPPVESSADALSIALSHGDDAMVELLCSYGAAREVDLLAHYGDLRTAAAAFAANPALANDPGAFCSAVGNGHTAFVHLMLHCQPDLISRVSVAGKSRELTELLFARGMDPSRGDWLGITPLHEFARRGDLERAALFLEHGANLHARDDDMRSTPLGWAACFGQLEMIELLLNRGARIQHPDDPPWATPLAWAIRRGHERVAALLRSRAHPPQE
jgi:ankyrin repeat protein